MDEVLISWIVLGIVFILWLFNLCNLKRCGSWLLTQWYLWFIALFGVLHAYNLCHQIGYDFLVHGSPQFLNPDGMLGLLEERLEVSDCKGDLKCGLSLDGLKECNYRKELYLGEYTAMLGSFVPFLNTITFMIVARHILHLDKLGLSRSATGDGLPRGPRHGPTVHYLMGVLAMPLSMSVVGNQAWVRLMTLMTGSAYQSKLCKPCDGSTTSSNIGSIVQRCDNSKAEITLLEFATSQSDLHVGLACQYFSVLCFGMLCCYYYKHKSVGFRVRAFLGLWLFVFVGALQNVFKIVAIAASNASLHNPAHEKRVQLMGTVASVLADFTEKCMLPLTIVCMGNMMICTEFKELKSPQVFGSTGNWKFLLSRLLLLAGTVQPQVLALFLHPGHEGERVLGIWFYTFSAQEAEAGKSVMQKLCDDTIGWCRDIDRSKKGIYQPQMWHTTLLAYWALAVAIANACCWKHQVPTPEATPSIAAGDPESPSLKQSLLRSGDPESPSLKQSLLRSGDPKSPSLKQRLLRSASTGMAIVQICHPDAPKHLSS